MSVPPPATPVGSALALPAPPPRDRWTAERVVLIVAVSILCVAGVALAIWLASRSGDTEGAALVLILASVPVPLVVACFLWLDRYDPEPVRFLLAAFVWGGAIAPLVVQVPYYLLDKADVSYKVLATAWAPILEETAKGLFLVVVLLIRRREFAGVVDGLVYAGLVGIGFAFTENILYYAGAYSGELSEELSGAEGTTAIFVARGIFSPFSHPLFAAAFGVGVGVAVATRRRSLKIIAPVLGLAVGMGFHALWNGSVSYWGGKGFLLVYGLGFVPIFLGGIALGAWVRGHQGRVAIRGLDDAVARGWLHPDEIPWLARFGLRRRARKFAARYGGPTAAAALARYQKAALKMAFAHDRARQGKGPLDGPERVRNLLTEMAQMRPYILMPPPLQIGSPAGPHPPAPHWYVHSPPGGWPQAGPMRQTGPAPGSHAASPHGVQPGPPIDPYHPRRDSPPAESDPW
ncbi:MAG TPA: PrsW family intramembrane metalloprotease [Nocardioidaceae bacterium]|nr:PrsW family intramembrane metalloprotease [Nocardioidaceae bacterium]